MPHAADPVVPCRACHGARVLAPLAPGREPRPCEPCNGTGLRVREDQDRELALADTIPPVKRCSCGASYDGDAWRALPYVGLQRDGYGGAYELRTCPACLSTMSLDTLLARAS